MTIEKTVQEVVESLNWKLWGEKGDNNVYCAFTYENATVWELVRFYDTNFGLEIILWNSEDDNREYREETDDYEPLEDYILREFSKITGSLFKVDNFLNNKNDV